MEAGVLERALVRYLTREIGWRSEVDVEKLYAKIGQLEMENDFLKKI